MHTFSDILAGRMDNNILPFFWQHHEDEATLRKYMEVIEKSNIRAVCVESRPHPDFCGPDWWNDLDIILDEAEKRQMKVWILDDSHFPSGFANGALRGGFLPLHRQFIVCQKIDGIKDGRVCLPEDAYTPPAFVKSPAEQFLMKDTPLFPDDQCLGFVAVEADGQEFRLVKDGQVLPGEYTLYALYKTRNRGPHRDYINMLDRDAVRKFLDAVYEPHYAHYQKYFGRVIEGFFSDEPEIGNGHLYETGKQLCQMEDIPWSEEAEAKLSALWGDRLLPNLIKLFCAAGDPQDLAACRIQYMDVVTELVEKNFSCQIGDWCRQHNVKYIGHMIEDHNQHSRTGSSLGHYFRGLKGQSWAGFDVIGGQVIPQSEDAVIASSFTHTVRDGVFYQFTLSKLGPSAAAIDPLKQGNTMCELFGAYGWEEGVYLEKYLVDHVMVRGTNHFVPHAFSPKAFPDPDCPPHFYAHGHNPQYRHFGDLMLYTNRVSNLLSGGRAVRKAAILYHGEADWSCLDYMKEDVVTRALTEAQIDFDILPSDVFLSGCGYSYQIKEGKLCIGLGEYDAVILPTYPVIRSEVAKALNLFMAAGGRVLCIDKLPDYSIGGEEQLAAPVCSLAQLTAQLDDLKEVRFSGDGRYLRYIHYQNHNDVFFFVNESADAYQGQLTLPLLPNPVIYDAWTNKVYPLTHTAEGNTMKVDLCLEPRKSLLVYSDGQPYSTEETIEKKMQRCTQLQTLTTFTRSICAGVDYPQFRNQKAVSLPDRVEDELPQFGGFIRYSTIVTSHSSCAYLEIDEPLEGVEVFVNGHSLGIQIVPTYRYDLSSCWKEGENEIVIISATTLERAVEKRSRIPGEPVPPPQNPLGIHGSVKLYTC